MNERNARAEHNTQYSVPPIFDGDLGWDTERNEIRNPGNASAASKRSVLNSKDGVKNGSEEEGEQPQPNEKSHEQVDSLQTAIAVHRQLTSST